MGNKHNPPPTRPADDGYEHRRSGDPPSRPTLHTRWYDSTRVQLVGLATALVLLMGAVAMGYALRDRLKLIDETPIREQAFMDVNASQWAAINRHTAELREVRRAQRETASALDVLICVTTAPSAWARDQCMTDEARRRLRNLQYQNGGNH